MILAKSGTPDFARVAREPGTHNRRPGLRVPGSPPRGAPGIMTSAEPSVRVTTLRHFEAHSGAAAAGQVDGGEPRGVKPVGDAILLVAELELDVARAEGGVAAPVERLVAAL